MRESSQLSKVLVFPMADSHDPTLFTALEEEYIREYEANGDIDQQLQREKDVASQKLWVSFQDSATAVAHLFRDCQHQAGLVAWVPFHESASAVTQLYKESVEVCRQCSDFGIKYGQRKRTKEIIAWVRKKRKHIDREELLAFLLDKPYTESSTTPTNKHEGSDVNELSAGHHPFTDLSMNHQHVTSSGLNHLQSTPCSLGSYSSPHFLSSTSVSSPRRRTVCRDDSSCTDGETFLIPNGRKRSANTSSCSSLEFGLDSDNGPFAKRMRF